MAGKAPGFKRASDFINTHAQEATKQYLVYDGADRLTDHYVALADAQNGDPCIVTTYTYRSPSSTQVFQVKETLAVWDSSWDF